jgi:hypothetical protein
LQVRDLGASGILELLESLDFGQRAREIRLQASHICLLCRGLPEAQQLFSGAIVLCASRLRGCVCFPQLIRQSGRFNLLLC